MRSALCWSLVNKEAALALRLGAALWRFWEVRGCMAEGLGWLDQALALQVESAIEVRARALEAAGHLARSLGRYDRATVFYAGALQARLSWATSRASRWRWATWAWSRKWAATRMPAWPTTTPASSCSTSWVTHPA